MAQLTELVRPGIDHLETTSVSARAAPSDRGAVTVLSRVPQSLYGGPAATYITICCRVRPIIGKYRTLETFEAEATNVSGILSLCATMLLTDGHVKSRSAH